MAQIASRGEPGPVVTVAELMRRCAPAADPTDDEGADPIPVAALLRREGHSAAGLPVVQAPATGDPPSTAARAAPDPAPGHHRGRRAPRRGLRLRAHRRHDRARDPADSSPASTPTRATRRRPPSSALDPGHRGADALAARRLPDGFTSDAASAQSAAPGPPRGRAPSRGRQRRRSPARRARPPPDATTENGLVAEQTKKLGDTVDEVGKARWATVQPVVRRRPSPAGRRRHRERRGQGHPDPACCPPPAGDTASGLGGTVEKVPRPR